MTRLKVLLCFIPCEKLDQNIQIGIKAAVRMSFCRVYGTKESELAITLADGRSAAWDVAIAYDRLPAVPEADSSKCNAFRDRVTDELNRVFPLSLAFGGRVTVRSIDRVRVEEQNNGEMFSASEGGESELTYEKMAGQFQAEEPRFSFEQLVLSPDVEERLLEAVSVLENRETLFERWNLKAIMSPSVLLNLYGAPGTGKSMAAEALASRLGKRIIRTTYADIESKYHGEGPKRLKALFLAALRQNAILFIDEADSMLSARLTNVSDGSAQAINSMRSQLLISLENFDGIVIFATNLIENYDKAFLTRLICIEIERPTKELRRTIWFNHLFPRGDDEKTLRIPLADDVDLNVLSEYDFCGRDIRNAVKQACIGTVLKKKDKVDQGELVLACERTIHELEAVAEATQGKKIRTEPASADERERLINQALEKVRGKT